MKFLPIFVISFALSLVADASVASSNVVPPVSPPVAPSNSLTPLHFSVVELFQWRIRDVKKQISKMEYLIQVKPLTTDLLLYSSSKPHNVGQEDIAELKRLYDLLEKDLRKLNDRNTNTPTLRYIQGNMTSLTTKGGSLTPANVARRITAIKGVAEFIKTDLKTVLLLNGVTADEFNIKVDQEGTYAMEKVPFVAEFEWRMRDIKYQIGKLEYLIQLKPSTTDLLYDIKKPHNVDNDDIKNLQRPIDLLERSVQTLNLRNTEKATLQDLIQSMASLVQQRGSVTHLNVDQTIATIKTASNNVMIGVKAVLLRSGVTEEQFNRRVVQAGIFGISHLQRHMANMKHQIGKLEHYIAKKLNVNDPDYNSEIPYIVDAEDITDLKAYFIELKKSVQILNSDNIGAAPLGQITRQMTSLDTKLTSVTHLNVGSKVAEIKTLFNDIKTKIGTALEGLGVTPEEFHRSVNEAGTFELGRTFEQVFQPVKTSVQNAWQSFKNLLGIPEIESKPSKAPAGSGGAPAANSRQLGFLE